MLFVSHLLTMSFKKHVRTLNCFFSFRPQVGFVIVKKRLNTRFFKVNGGREPGNPPPGTVVDTEVTRPEWCVVYLKLLINGVIT